MCTKAFSTRVSTRIHLPYIDRIMIRIIGRNVDVSPVIVYVAFFGEGKKKSHTIVGEKS